MKAINRNEFDRSLQLATAYFVSRKGTHSVFGADGLKNDQWLITSGHLTIEKENPTEMLGEF
jgi:hypothetical protein